MRKALLDHYHEILGAILAVGCVLHPASAAVGLLIIVASRHADKYLTSNISDAERAELQSIKADIAKLKTKAEQDSISKAFRSP